MRFAMPELADLAEFVIFGVACVLSMVGGSF